jgi:PIN domain nuclease of toxin-antitoxin system
LLDSHALLWWLADDKQLGEKARKIISDAQNQIYVSAASSWEISIKKALGKLQAPEGLDDIVDDEGFEKLAISFFHGEKAGALPAIHNDPFDRMIVAQAQAEGLEVITKDAHIPRYGAKVIDAHK